MRLLNSSITSSLYNYLKEGFLLDKSRDEPIEDYIDRDFSNYLKNNNIENVSEDVINDYFTDLFYELEDEYDLEEINKAESFIRNKYLVSKLEESSKKKQKNKKKSNEKRVIMKQGNITCLKDGNNYLVFEDEDKNKSEYKSQEEAMRDMLNRCGINPDNELKEE